MSLLFSPMPQHRIPVEPNETASVLPASTETETTPVNNGTADQTIFTFNDALNTLMGSKQPHEYDMLFAGVSSNDDGDKQAKDNDDLTLEPGLISSPYQLLDAILMTSQMPVKALNATLGGPNSSEDALNMQPFSAGPQPIGSQLKAVSQPLTFNITETAKPAIMDTVKPLVTGQPAAVEAFSNALEKQVVNQASIKMDANDVKWTQQLHNALSERLQFQVRNNVQHATIRLDPPEMGKVDISLQIENGRMQVYINASNSETHRAIQQISNDLRQSLTEQNFVQVNVQVSSQSGQQQRQRQAATEETPDTGAVIEAEDTQSYTDKDDSVLLRV